MRQEYDDVANTSESHCRRRRPTEKQRCKLERPIEGINDVTSDDPVSPLCMQKTSMARKTFNQIDETEKGDGTTLEAH
jgi:hypothetical protein